MRLQQGAVPRSGRAPAVATLLASLLAFGLVLLLVQQAWPPLVGLDTGVRDSLHRTAVAAPHFVQAMKAVSTLGTSIAYLVLFGLLVAHLLRRGRLRPAAFVAATVIGSSLLNTAVKAGVDRARPAFVDPVAQAAYSSFPSGHAQGVVVAGGVLLVVLWSPLGRARRLPAVLVLLAWALLMGFSRVALGVHYVSDVLGGYLLAIAWLAVCAAAFRPWRVRSR